MNFGHFDDANKEYVITTPDTPLPWINYLGSQDFFTLISNTCGGYSFYKDAKLLRITRYRYNNIPVDSNGKYYYIKDGDTVWNPGAMPTRTPLDVYECRHGLGYSRFHGEKNGLAADLLAFVPVDTACEINKLTLRNNSDKVKEISLFSYVEFCLWNAVDDMTNYQRNLSTGEVEIIGSTIYHKTEYRERRNHYSFFTVNTPVDGFDTSRDEFLGLGRGNNAPIVVEEGKSHNSVASGWYPIASQQINVSLAPGEEKEYVFLLGYCENPKDDKWEALNVIKKEPAKKIMKKFETSEQVNEAFAILNTYWNDLLSRYHVESKDPHVNRMANIWNQYQCMVTFNMSRSASYYESGTGRGMGFRDSCQDLLGFVHLIPERARERILDIAATQFEDGSAYHQYQPLTKQGNLDIGSGFNDDPLWLIAAVAAYLKETGDYSILDEMVAFDCHMEKAAPLFEHLRRSFEYSRTHLGPHKLPLIGRADWNDCLNLNCFSWDPNESFQTTENKGEGSKAESLMIAGLFVVTGKDYVALCKQLAKEAMESKEGEIAGLAEEDYLTEAERMQQAVDEMNEAVKQHGWDGEWFLRAYDFFGNKIGSDENEEGKIFIESQGWCTMAGIGLEEGLCDKALDSSKKRLECEHGLVLNNPAYTTYHVEMGEISSYPEGYKENAGIFCHNNPWISCAEAVLGHGDRAFEVYRKTCPAYIEDISEIHRTEPYVYSQMVAGKDAPTFGEAKNSWLTGTAAWTFFNVSQYILGIQPTLDGLKVDPCIPHTLGGFTVTRRYRGATYHIAVDNTAAVQYGVKSVDVDGKPIEGSLLPLAPEGAVVEVQVTMG